MSTAAQEPRRVGPRRSDAPSASKVSPRRNTPETSEPNGLRYDSDELPVLIRLPNLRDVGSVEARPASTTQKKRHRIDRASAGKQNASTQDTPRESKKSFQQQAGDNRMVLGGIFGGIVLVVTLFWFNAGGSTPPTDQDSWASEAAELGSPLQEPEVSVPTENPVPELYPGFAYEAPSAEASRLASDELEPPLIGVSYPQEPRESGDTETAALPNRQRTIVGWPSDEAINSPSTSNAAPTDLWPGENLSIEQGGYESPSKNSPGPNDLQSSKYPSETESYRMGKLESERQQQALGDPSSILNGNIEIPDTTSLR